MTDRAEQNDRELPQLIHRAVGQHFLGAQIPLAAKIVVGIIEFDAELLRRHVENLDRFTYHFGACAVAADNCNIVRFHGNTYSRKPGLLDGSRDSKAWRKTCNRILISR